MSTQQSDHPASKMVGEWTSPPKLPPLPSFSDGPYTGNGDIGLTWGGPPELVTTYVGKKDFWTGVFFRGMQRRWGMLLTATILWDAPALKGLNYSARMELGSGETSFQFTNHSTGFAFHSATFVGQADTPKDANYFVTKFSVDAEPLNLTLRVQPGNPAVSSPTYHPGKTWGGAYGTAGVWTSRNNTNNTGVVVNPYQPGPGAPHDQVNDTKLTVTLTAAVYAADGGAEPDVTVSVNPDTGFHTLVLTLKPGRTYALVCAVACGECGVSDSKVEAARLAGLVASQPDRDAARGAASGWWTKQWESTPVIKHFSDEATKFYYGALFAMAASKRAGTVGIDRQGPFMTQDNAIWPYICNNYNLQAPYYGMLATNQAWMLKPMLDRVLKSVPYFQQRASKLLVNVVGVGMDGNDVPPPSAFGSYDGINMPGHIGAYEWMYDGESIGQDAGQRFNAPFTAMLFVDYFDFTLDLQFLKESAYPFLRQTVDFIESYVTNSSDGKGGAYTAHIHHGCAQEMCPGQPANPGPGESKWQKQHYGDTTVDLAFFKLALRSAIRLSARLLVDTDKRRRWQALLDHLAPYTTTELPAFAGTYQDRPPADQDPRTVFALSKNYSAKVRWNTSQLTQYAIVYTAPMYPATDTDVTDNDELRSVAVRTLRNLPTVPYNGAQQVWNAAVRVGYPPIELVDRYQPFLEAGLKAWPNFRVDFGSSNGMENAGLVDGLNDMLMQSWRGYIELFPCWPKATAGSFEGLQARGAFTVTAKYSANDGASADGGTIADVMIVSQFGGTAFMRTPWTGIVPAVNSSGGGFVSMSHASQFGDGVYEWVTDVGQTYLVIPFPLE